jgi:hypothetical protein
VPADGERDAPLVDREVRAFRKRRIRRITRCAPVFAIEIQRCQARWRRWSDLADHRFRRTGIVDVEIGDRKLAPGGLVGIERDRLLGELDAVRVPALQAPAEFREADKRWDVEGIPLQDRLEDGRRLRDVARLIAEEAGLDDFESRLERNRSKVSAPDALASSGAFSRMLLPLVTRACASSRTSRDPRARAARRAACRLRS